MLNSVQPVKWLNEHIRLDQDVSIAAAWFVVVGYAFISKPTFAQFWPAAIALAGLHTVHNIIGPPDQFTPGAPHD